MLQHNGIKAGRRAHFAHAAVVCLHAVCCGLPALALFAAAAFGAASGVLLVSDSVGELHAFLHRYEVWVLVFSAALVVAGGWFEAIARRHHSQGFPWLFAFSVLCFVVNVAVILTHRAI
jgi:hypothetical protein